MGIGKGKYRGTAKGKKSMRPKNRRRARMRYGESHREKMDGVKM